MINKSGVVPTRREIEEKIAKVGDYVKMDYLARCLKSNLDFDTRKYVLNTLAKVYESRGMFSEAGKLMRASADINTTFEGKTNDFVKSVELFVKATNFDEAETTFSKALALATGMQKDRLKLKRKEFYKAKAQELLKKDQRKHAMTAYEKLLALDLNAQEKQEVQGILAGLYEKLGKVREYYNIKKAGNTPAVEPKKEEVKKQSYNRVDESVDELIGNVF